MCTEIQLGLTRMVEGQTIDEIIKRLKGIPCGHRLTSCPDQLTKALEEIKKQAG